MSCARQETHPQGWPILRWEEMTPEQREKVRAVMRVHAGGLAWRSRRIEGGSNRALRPT